LSGGNDGAFPYAGFIQGKDGNLYGMTEAGGAYSVGTIYELSLSGAFRTIYAFGQATWPAYAGGGNPHARLAQGADGNFYGATEAGGSSYLGMLFQMYSNAPESIFPIHYLYSFTGGLDGNGPTGALVQGADGNFYGLTPYGGASGKGNAFRITPGGVLTTLYSFTGGSDGYSPAGALIRGADGNFYGVTTHSVLSGIELFGTVFRLTPSGALTTLHGFGDFILNDGLNPYAGLIQSVDGNLYGTTYTDHRGGNGTVFRMAPDGSSFATLVYLNGFDGGAHPATALAEGADGCSAPGESQFSAPASGRTRTEGPRAMHRRR